MIVSISPVPSLGIPLPILLDLLILFFASLFSLTRPRVPFPLVLLLLNPIPLVSAFVLSSRPLSNAVTLAALFLSLVFIISQTLLTVLSAYSEDMVLLHRAVAAVALDIATGANTILVFSVGAGTAAALFYFLVLRRAKCGKGVKTTFMRLPFAVPDLGILALLLPASKIDEFKEELAKEAGECVTCMTIRVPYIVFAATGYIPAILFALLSTAP